MTKFRQNHDKIPMNYDKIPFFLSYYANLLCHVFFLCLFYYICTYNQKNLAYGGY